MPVSYINGDATQPQGEGIKIIAHVCNDSGRWGKGFVVALTKRSPEPERAFRQWYKERQDNDFGLGAMQLVQIAPDTWVANLIGQHKTAVQGRGADAIPPVRYDAIEQALDRLGQKALALQASVHMPRIGCGLAGGKWELIEPLISRQLSERGLEVVVYDWDG